MLSIATNSKNAAESATNDHVKASLPTNEVVNRATKFASVANPVVRNFTVPSGSQLTDTVALRRSMRLSTSPRCDRIAVALLLLVK